MCALMVLLQRYRAFFFFTAISTASIIKLDNYIDCIKRCCNMMWFYCSLAVQVPSNYMKHKDGWKISIPFVISDHFQKRHLRHYCVHFHEEKAFFFSEFQEVFGKIDSD